MKEYWTQVRIPDQAKKRAYPDSLRCTHCGSDNTIPIFYGYPTEASMDALLAAVDRGEIKLGGCCVDEGMPTYHCKDCQRDSGRLVLRERSLKRPEGDRLDTVDLSSFLPAVAGFSG